MNKHTIHEILTVFLLCLVVFNVLPGRVSASVSEGCMEITANLKLGSTDAQNGNEVSCLQKFLVRKSLLVSEPTGYFGKQTQIALKIFQQSQGISQTGNTGPQTRRALLASLSSVGLVNGCTNNASFNILTGATCSKVVPVAATSTAQVSPTKVHFLSTPFLFLETNPDNSYKIFVSYTLDIENTSSHDIQLDLLPKNNVQAQTIFTETLSGRTFAPTVNQVTSGKTAGSDGSYILKPGVRDIFNVKQGLYSLYNYTAKEARGEFIPTDYTKLPLGTYKAQITGILAQYSSIIPSPMISNAYQLTAN